MFFGAHIDRWKRPPNLDGASRRPTRWPAPPANPHSAKTRGGILFHATPSRLQKGAFLESASPALHRRAQGNATPDRRGATPSSHGHNTISACFHNSLGLLPDKAPIPAADNNCISL